jgi:Uma2 family endonuclease
LEFYNQQHKAGLVLFAPVDVYLSPFTTMEPDLVFVSQSRLSIVQEEKIVGAPDLAVEVLSPSTEHVDRGQKSQVYARAGVREYWIVDPEARTIEIFVLRQGAYESIGKHGAGETVRSEILPGFKVKVDEICPG